MFRAKLLKPCGEPIVSAEASADTHNRAIRGSRQDVAAHLASNTSPWSKARKEALAAG